MRWIPFPFIRILFFFIAGILFGIYQPNAFSFIVVSCLLVMLVALYFFTLLLNYPVRKITQGLIAFLAVFVCGYFHGVYKTDLVHENHISKQAGVIEFYSAVLSKACEEKDKHWKTEAHIDKVRINGKWKNATGNVQLYFSKKDFSKPYQYGDCLLVQGTPQEVLPPANPGEFDYKRFLHFKNIYHQQFLTIRDVKLVKQRVGYTFFEWSFAIRGWANTTLKKHIEGKREHGIASALILGVNDGLDNELVNAYSSSGTLHVLSVSGLHVGIVYLIIMFVFKPLNKSKTGRWIVAILSILILWLYAFITGLSPSVLRAVAMFSFVALSTPSSRRTNVYNTLAISALCLLLYDPFLIMSVGFQLSYLAVLGIVYLQPLLYKLWEPKAKILDELWKVTSVSIAAQVATFSLGLLYFHQFPNYFLISNLLVIPISSLVLILGIGMLALSFITPLATWIGFLLKWLITGMNMLVFTIDSLPFSHLENIYITNFQCMLLLGIVVLIICAVKYKSPAYLYASIVSIILFSTLQWFSFYEKISEKRITFYKIPNHGAIDLVDHGLAYFITDSILYRDANKIRFHINPNRVMYRATRVVNGYDHGFIKRFSGGEILCWNGKLLLHLTSKNFQLPSLPPLDYLVIGNNAVNDIHILKKKLNFKKVIIDSSNSFYVASNILKSSIAHKLDVHSILHHGAFVDVF